MPGRKWAILAFASCLATSARAQEADAPRNWAAAPFWSAADNPRATGSRSALTVSSAPLPFVPLTPCRVADTRAASGFTGGYGPPFMPGSLPRNFTIAGQCGIPLTALAVSFNFTVVNTAGPGFLLAFPAGLPRPNVSTLNYSAAGETIANAASIALGTGGAVTAIPGVSGFDVIIDVNGYYGPGVVTSLNTLIGDVSLVAGNNVSITPGPGTLTLDAAVGSGPTGPTGLAGPMGASGPTGPSGLAGAMGPTGATGIAGPMGASGPTGPSGPAGAMGPTGATGIAGPMGVSGPSGPTGADGQNGTSGGLLGGIFNNPSDGDNLSLLGAVTASENNVQIPVTNGHARNLFVRVTNAPGAAGSGVSINVVIRKNGANTGLNCTILETATTCNDTASGVAFVDGDLISARYRVLSGVPAAARLLFSVEFRGP